MTYKTILDRIIAQEEFAAIITSLTPIQTIHAALRVAGLNDVQIADLLECSRNNVSRTRAHALHSIERHHPELLHHLRDRSIIRRRPNHKRKED